MSIEYYRIPYFTKNADGSNNKHLLGLTNDKELRGKVDLVSHWGQSNANEITI